MASVKEIPKKSPVLQNNRIITTSPNTDCKLPESNRVIDNERKIHKSSHISRTVPHTRSKNQPILVECFNQIFQSKTSFADSGVRPPTPISPLILNSKRRGKDDGGHSLPSIYQINTLRQRQPCECLKNIRTSPYTYTVCSYLFDSAMFCLLRSNYF